MNATKREPAVFSNDPTLPKLFCNSSPKIILLNSWLQNFPYRVSISWTVFGIAAVTAVAIALITVSFQSIKAATTNPVKNLRSE